jgi:hypothetical protein
LGTSDDTRPVTVPKSEIDGFSSDMFKAFAASQYGDIDAAIVQVSGAFSMV